VRPLGPEASAQAAQPFTDVANLRGATSPKVQPSQPLSASPTPFAASLLPIGLPEPEHPSASGIRFEPMTLGLEGGGTDRPALHRDSQPLTTIQDSDVGAVQPSQPFAGSPKGFGARAGCAPDCSGSGDPGARHGLVA